MTEDHFCKTLTPLPTGNRAAVLVHNRWKPRETITVSFLDGDVKLQNRVIRAARGWFGRTRANLNLEVKETGPTDIRIAFQQGQGSWSYLGTDCRSIPHSQPTMNFGWLTPELTNAELYPVVLHEFGHALGLIHEHQNPKKPIRWNRDAVIRDLSGYPNNWDRQTIEWNMFFTHDPSKLLMSELDPHSIMMYPIPAKWTQDGFSTGMNGGLSRLDRNIIRLAYQG